MIDTNSLMLFIRPGRLGAAIWLLLLAGCTHAHGDPAAVITPCDTSPQTVTYAGIISPIFEANCRECHANDKAAALGGNVAFGNYQDINRYPAPKLLGSMQQAAGYDPMPKGRSRLSDCDLLRMKAWIDAGEPNN